jgi:iron complex outermembrane receptor protein
MKRRMAVLAVIIGAANLLLAQSTKGPAAGGARAGGVADTNNGAFNLGTVTVTAPPDSGFARLGTTVTSEALRDTDVKNVAQAASTVPGVAFSRVGPRNEQAVFVRGFDLRQVPVFLDGMPVYVPYDGYVDLGRFLTFDAAQVTVEKGFSSVLYGPNTLGGAINVVSRRPTRELEGSVGMGVRMDRRGEFPENFGYLNVGTLQGRFYYQGSVSYDTARFFTLPESFDGKATQPEGKRVRSNTSDWQLLQRVGFVPYADRSDEYSVTYAVQEGKKGMPVYAGSHTNVVTPRYWNCPQWDKESVMFASRTEVTDDLTFRSRAFWDSYQNIFDSYDDASYTTQTKKYAFHSVYNDYTVGGSGTLDYRLDERTTASASVMLKDDVHREHNRGEPTRHFEDQAWSFGAEIVHRLLPDLELTAGTRYDYRRTLQAEDYNSKTKAVSSFPLEDMDAWNGQLGAIYHVDKNNEVYATYAHNTRLPTMKDRFSYKLGTAIPNPGLGPETADNFELGARGRINERITYSTGVFCDFIQDTIQSVAIAPNTNQSQNVGSSRIVGWDLGTEVEIVKALSVGGSYTLLQRENLSNSTIKPTDTPKNILTVFLSWKPLEHLELRPEMVYESGRYSSSDGVQQTSPFAIFNVMARYEILTGLDVQVGVDNIGDRLYEVSEGYPEAGRTYYARANYRF